MVIGRMLSDRLKGHLSSLRRRQGSSDPVERGVAASLAGYSADLSECFPEGAICETARGEIFACEVGLREIYADAPRLVQSYLGAFETARQLDTDNTLPSVLEPLSQADADTTVLIDTETTGLHGRPLFLIGLVRHRGRDLVVSQYFARNYAQEAGVLAKLAGLLPELALLISFNGKAFDWPFVRDRMTYHRLPCPASTAHLDLLHPSRRRWRAYLPNCKLTTLERYLCGRWRSGDIPGADIPQRYHDFVREQDARLIAPIFHHNRMDLITMVELLVALVGQP